MNVDISRCILCGITENDSIMFNIRNQNTLATLKIKYVNEQKQKDNHDDLEKMQRQVISQKKLKLLCPQEIDVNKHCHSIIELSKILMKYKQGFGKSDNILVHANELQISCVQFKNIFIKSVNAIATKYPKIPSTQMNLLQQMITVLNKNDEIISDIRNSAMKKGKKKTIYKHFSDTISNKNCD
eukprot:521757_1